MWRRFGLVEFTPAFCPQTERFVLGKETVIVVFHQSRRRTSYLPDHETNRIDDGGLNNLSAGKDTPGDSNRLFIIVVRFVHLTLERAKTVVQNVGVCFTYWFVHEMIIDTRKVLQHSSQGWNVVCTGEKFQIGLEVDCRLSMSTRGKERVSRSVPSDRHNH